RLHFSLEQPTRLPLQAGRCSQQLRTDRAQITFTRSGNCCFCICEDARFPPRTVNLLEWERLNVFEDAVYCSQPEWNKVRITSHEAYITAILYDLNDVTREQRALAACTSWPMQNTAALKMSAAINQREIIPKRKRCSFPKLNARTLLHDPLTIRGVQEY